MKNTKEEEKEQLT